MITMPAVQVIKVIFALRLIKESLITILAVQVDQREPDQDAGTSATELLAATKQ